jgi:hypothetical protein
MQIVNPPLPASQTSGAGHSFNLRNSNLYSLLPLPSLQTPVMTPRILKASPPLPNPLADFCGEHNIVCNIEKIPIDYVNTAMDRLLKNDVHYRHVPSPPNSVPSARQRMWLAGSGCCGPGVPQFTW